MEFEKQENEYLTGKDVKGVSGITLEFIDEVKQVSTDFGVKPKGTVKVTKGDEVYTKKLTLNQQNVNFCHDAFGKDSTNWIGKKIGIFTETIKGNESIRFQGV